MERSPARIRKFRMEDIDKVLEVEKQAFPKSIYSKQTFLYFARTLPGTFIIAEVGRDIVGYIIFDATGHIYSIVVDPGYRRKGFGAILVIHALKCIEKPLWLEVRSRNIGAINFYKKLGMKITGKIPEYYGSDDALVMVFPSKE